MEVGYPARRGGTAAPWDYTTDAPVDLVEQALGYTPRGKPAAAAVARCYTGKVNWKTRKVN